MKWMERDNVTWFRGIENNGRVTESKRENQNKEKVTETDPMWKKRKGVTENFLPTYRL